MLSNILTRVGILVSILGSTVQHKPTLARPEDFADEVFVAKLSATAETEILNPISISPALIDELLAGCKQKAVICAEYIAVLRRVGRVTEARAIALDALHRAPRAWPLWTSLGLLLASDGESVAAR